MLHEGRQIYFGPTKNAKKYFTDLGFIVPARSTTPEFLTSVTRPLGLRPPTTEKVGWPPRNAAHFAQAWKASSEYAALISEIETYNRVHPIGDEKNLRAMRRALKGTAQKLLVCSKFRADSVC